MGLALGSMLPELLVTGLLTPFSGRKKENASQKSQATQNPQI
jgi:hypothetical protein